MMNFYFLFWHNRININEYKKLVIEFNFPNQLAIFVESLKDIEIIKYIRANFPIENYLIIKSEKIHKRTYLPLLKSD